MGRKPLNRTAAFEERYTPEPNSGCWLWIGDYKSDGYGRFSGVSAHRLAWALFKGELPRDMVVCHRCDVPICVNPDHLFIGTHADNHADMCRKGRDRHVPLPGERNPRAKLTAMQVEEIRGLTGSATPIAARFGVTPEQINNIRRRAAWRAA